MVLWLRAIDLRNSDQLESVLLVGGSAPPFIDEGDGFTSERVRVRMLSSLVAQAYRALLPTPRVQDIGRRLQDCCYYCRMSDAHGRSCCLFQGWWTLVPANIV